MASIKAGKFGGKINAFGTWVRSAKPEKGSAQPSQKKQAQSAWVATQCLMVPASDILGWPVAVEPGSKEYSEGCRVPFDAFNYFRVMCAFDLSLPQYTTADRGKARFEQVMWRMHEEQQRSQ